MANYQEIETRRCADVFYGILFNSTIRQNIFQHTLEILNKRLQNYEKSYRLTCALNRVSSTSIVLLQHVFIFFAIVHEKNVMHFIINHYKVNSPRRKEVETFINTKMKSMTEDLLNGKYRSIVEYVDELRATMTFDIGFE